MTPKVIKNAVERLTFEMDSLCLDLEKSVKIQKERMNGNGKDR